MSDGFENNGSSIAQPSPSDGSTFEGANGALDGGLGDGIGGRIAEAEEDLLGAGGFAVLQEGDGVFERLDAEEPEAPVAEQLRG